MTWILSRLIRGPTSRVDTSQVDKCRARERRARFFVHARATFVRTVRLEQLEDRALMASLPFGAMADDLGEYLLGDVHVSVVRLESTPSRAPGDNGSITYNVNGVPVEFNYEPENWPDWDPGDVGGLQGSIEEGIRWWEATLDALPNVRDGLLNFTIDWTHFNDPVEIGYEPIARKSEDVGLWVTDFLQQVGVGAGQSFLSGIRAFNNLNRVQSGADWAFTIFVINDQHDPDNKFNVLSSLSQAFTFPGGHFMAVPASRPASTYAHELGHIFWAFDEYPDSDGIADEYLRRRGYYNTQNTNAADNPAPGFVQADSIMANGQLLLNAYAQNTSSQSSLEMIGWRDSDGDGIFDVLDVPLTLEGTGRLDTSGASPLYRFTGFSSVNTLPNQNTAGLQNDITINQVRVLEYQLDDGPWVLLQQMPARTYQASLDVSIPIAGGDHFIRLRTHDTRTGVTSNVFEDEIDGPWQSTPVPGAGGFVFMDHNGNGAWDEGEPPLPDVGVKILDEANTPLDFRRFIEPDEHDSNDWTVLNAIHPDVTLTAIGSDAASGEVLSVEALQNPAAGNVFGPTSIASGGNRVATWNAARQLRIDFDSPTSMVSLRVANAAQFGATSFARLEAYNSAGKLVGRVTSSGLTGNGFATLRLSRPEGDVDYVIARTHINSSIVLFDTLEWGPAASATTNTLGVYSLAGLPEGTYKIKVTAPPGHIITTPPGSDGTATVAVAAGQTYGVNFGIHLVGNLWQNVANPLNVNNDAAGTISPIDALLVINWLNAHPGDPTLPSKPTPIVHGFVDVNGDGLCSPLDALLVINELNRQSSMAGEEAGEAATEEASAADPSAGEVGLASGDPEGETLAAPAAEWLHFDEIPGTIDDHDHDHADDDHDSDELHLAPSAAGLLPRQQISARSLVDRLRAKLAAAEEPLEPTLEAIAEDVSEAWSFEERKLRRVLARR